MQRSFTSSVQLYILMTVAGGHMFAWTTTYLIMTIWLFLLFLLLPQYLHNPREDDESSPKPLNISRLIKRIKLEPHLQLIPLALVDSLRGLLICMTPSLIKNSTSWLLLVNLEVVLGYCIMYKFKVFGDEGFMSIFNFKSKQSIAIMSIFSMAFLL